MLLPQKIDIQRVIDLKRVMRSRAATKVVCTSGTISVVYHETEVVHITKTGVEFNNGGYYRPTTKRCMNKVMEELNLPYRVWQVKGAWHVEIHGAQGLTSKPFDSSGSCWISREIHEGRCVA